MAVIDLSESGLYELRRSAADFESEDWQRVLEATAGDDMRRIDSAAELVGSYAVYGHFSDTEGLVSFARQADRPWTQLPNERMMRVVEIGTVWTKPEYRGRGIGGALIRAVSRDIQHEGGLPLAVCNELSQLVFAASGFTPIGNLATTPEGRRRIVLVNRATTEAPYKDVACGIRRIPRFKSMHL